MNCINCTLPIEQERLEAIPTTKVCVCCAKRGAGQAAKVRGVMVFDHKTGGSIQVINEETFKDWRKYNPYGRYTGRGSGVHRMMSYTER